MTDTMHRREVVELLAASLVTFTGVRSRPRSANNPELVAWLQQELKGIDLGPIAREWQSRHPEEDGQEAVTAAILHHRQGNEAIGAYIARRVASEHQAGQAEALDGWFLSPTEARLAVLLELSGGG